MKILDPLREVQVEVPCPGPLGGCDLEDYRRRAGELAHEAEVIHPVDPGRAQELIGVACELAITARDLEAAFVNRFRS